MNQQPNMLLFGATLGTVLLIVDLYVLLHWASFAKRRSLNSLWYRIPWGAALIVFVSLVAMLVRRHVFRIDGVDVTIMGLISFWYLPKFGIALILLGRDVIRGGRALVNRLRPRQQQPATTNAVSVPPTPTAANSAETSSSRREFLGTAAWSMSAVPFVLVGRGMWSTLYDFQVHRHELVLDKLPRAMDGFRIVQISDIHAGSFPDHRPFEEVRRIIMAERPDAIVITGDFVNQKPRELAVISRDLERLQAPYGVIASLGNHDHYHTPEEHRELVSGIRDMGVDLLINQHRRIGVDGASLVIAGTDNTGFRQTYARLDAALEGVDAHEPVILLAHDPTFWDREVVGKAPVDVMLSGHTHGGQFGVQLLGFEWSPARHIYRQWAGHYTKGQQQLYVNRGIGTVGPPLRIGIAPEVTVFTLRSAPSDKGLALR